MNEKVEGMTLELKLDHLGVQEGMKGLKRQLGVVNSEMKANLSAFDKSEKSMEKYQARIKGLNDRLKVQKKMYSQVEDELKQVNANYQKAKSSVKDVEKAYLKLVEANKKEKLALDKSKEALKSSNTELKKAENQYKRTNQRKQDAYQKLKQLRDAEQKLKNSNQATTAQLKRASDAVQKQSAKHKALVEQYKQEGNQVQKLKVQNDNLSKSNDKIESSYAKTNTKLKQTEKEFNDLNNTIKNHSANVAKAETAVNKEKAALNNLERSIDKASSEMKTFNKEQMIAQSHFGKLASQADVMSKKFSSIGDKMTSLGRTMTMGVSTPITLGLGAALKTSADFEGQMSRVGAIAQASSKDLKSMSNQAVDLGAKTSKSANEVAKGMEELAALGFNAKQTMEAMPGVISAAEASGAEMATTATVMASAINSFGLKASDANHVADLLARSANDSAADIQYMGDALKYAGTPAKALGVSIEDTSAAIEVLSNSGLEGSQAGTALRASFIRLANPSKSTAKEMKKLGIHLSDAKGQFVGMGELIRQFQDNMKGMTREQKLATVATIVGTEAASGFLALIEAGPDKINSYSKSLKNSNGESKKAADLMKDNLKGALEQLGGAFESLAIEVGKDLTPMIRAGAEGLTKLVDGFTHLPGWVRKASVGLALFGAAIGPAVLAGGLLIRTVGSAAKGYASLNRRIAENTILSNTNSKAMKSLGLQTLFLGSTTGKTSKGFKGLAGAMMFNLKPINVLKNSAKLAILPFKLLKNGLGLAAKSLFAVSGGARFAGVALRFLTGPIGATITAITIAYKVFKTAYDRVEWFRNGINGLGETIKFFGGKIIGGAVRKLGEFKNYLGSIGKSFKEKFSKDMKDGYKSLSDDDLLKVGVNKFKGFMQTMGTASKKASDTVKVLGKGVSKETEKALEKYVHYSEENSRIMEKVRLNSGQISEDKAKKLLKIETDLSNNLIAEIEKRNKKELEKTQELIDKYSAFDEQEKQNILTRTKEKNDLRIKKEQELNQKIKELKEKALSDGQISENERKEIEKLENQRRDITVKELSKTEKEQERILVRMQRNRNAYSIDEASKAIKEAEKARKARKKEVDKQYEDDVIAIKNNVNLSKSEKDKLLAIADQRHKDEVRKAKSKKDAVVDVVKKQNKDIDKEMDLSSGRVYKNTEKWWNGLKSWWSNFREDQKKKSDKYAKEQEETARRNRENIKKWFGNAWDGVKSKTGEAFSKMGRNANHFGGEMKKMWSGIKGIPSKLSSGWSSAKSSVGYHTKAIANSTGKWFGKAWQSVKSTTGSIYNQTKQKYSDASDKAWAHSKSIWRGTSKWFSNAYKSAKGWLTDMANKSRAKWDNISSTAWSNAKSVWKGTSKWFSNSYKSLKDWTGDMYSRAHDRFDAISSSAWSNAKSVFNGFRKWLSKTYDWIRDIGKDMGRAAADLGKNVANKAIGGLNSMIGGINKISKAITDKNLIKPIPTLSTGTLAGKGVATDNSGALTQPTFAVLNDRGSGNAPGGGVQEVIHRADGTFHAPQGRDVVVPLGVGDSVINANDTLKLQRMGVLPKFHGGTKKKKWMEQVTENLGKKAGDFGSKAKNTAHNIKKGAEEMVEAAGDKIKDGASWLGDKIGDVWDYVQHPGKLVNKVMSGLNINFGGGANATVKLAKGAYSLLKKKLVDKVKSWFEDFGGGGDGSYLFEYPIWQRFGRYTGGLNFNGGRHYGIDFGMPSGTNVYAVKGGIADKVWTDYGGGNSIQIKTGANEWNWYMHLSKQLARQGQRIKAGQLIGKSGATGNFVRGAHLHFQLMQGSHPGNDTAKDPEKWLKSLKGSGVRSGSGVNKAASAWAGDIRRAAKRMGVNVTSGDVGNIISLIQHESGGNAGITQSSALRDINVLQGNPAKGLLQYIPQTFRHYAVRGHNNIYSGYDQLLAFFNNRYWRSQFNPRGGWSPSGPRRYANGGLITKHQLAEVGEGDKQEMVIPLTRRKRAIQLTEQVMRIIGMDGKPNNITVNNDTSTVEKLLKQIVMLSDKGNKLTDALIQTVSSQDNNLGSNDAIRGLEKILSKQSGHRANANNYMGGLTN
ncbi:TPA: phage tail tape measure protein [Staphylococcus aureus]|uniref:phage tail tape measure protein n=1 Tax=Staphylococcus aureus TaxID=1280 RepID=UPI0004462635|nr:phage tail tape measure protein [Staphylococcus aureus]EZR31344.1 phage tail tape measure protein, TP901 family, core region [Staphylococcus aureus ZTA09/03576-9HST]EZX18521.1 phage tail tape measure protein, TP901 family, core region [Staphylococcus aureus C1655]EZX24044.1 phage tail tape measure protein, TP901 family, core region [Staphylococcus aureus C1891]EZX69780.1 phage tail tape measure protein, TP901 family, core region [Staphylococcus aureus C5453]MCC5265607.1 phage tail tape meas